MLFHIKGFHGFFGFPSDRPDGVADILNWTSPPATAVAGTQQICGEAGLKRCKLCNTVTRRKLMANKEFGRI